MCRRCAVVLLTARIRLWHAPTWQWRGKCGVNKAVAADNMDGDGKDEHAESADIVLNMACAHVHCSSLLAAGSPPRPLHALGVVIHLCGSASKARIAPAPTTHGVEEDRTPVGQGTM